MVCLPAPGGRSYDMMGLEVLFSKRDTLAHVWAKVQGSQGAGSPSPQEPTGPMGTAWGGTGWKNVGSLELFPYPASDSPRAVIFGNFLFGPLQKLVRAKHFLRRVIFLSKMSKKDVDF